MRLLTVAVPTYNRPEKLKKLHDSFLEKVASTYQGIVEVIVCDNSDDLLAATNKNTLCSAISYNKNKENLGFSGNMVSCMNHASSEWVWIISDDDDVDWEAFQKFMGWLLSSDLTNEDIIMMPFYNGASNGKKKLVNTSEQWHVTENPVLLKSMIQHGKMLPFILFSGAVLRRKHVDKVQAIANEFKGNDYIQVPLFIALTGADANATFYSDALQSYKPDFNGRFPLLGLIRSMNQVVQYVEHEFEMDISGLSSRYYRGWLIWLTKHRIGQCNIMGADQARGMLLRSIFANFNVKNMLLALINIFPAFVTKVLYKQLLQKRLG